MDFERQKSVQPFVYIQGMLQQSTGVAAMKPCRCWCFEKIQCAISHIGLKPAEEPFYSNSFRSYQQVNIFLPHFRNRPLWFGTVLDFRVRKA